MDWGIHGIGADGTLEQLMDAACRRARAPSSSAAAASSSSSSSAAMGLAGEGVVLVVGLLVVDPVRRRDALDVIQIQLHSLKKDQIKIIIIIKKFT